MAHEDEGCTLEMVEQKLPGRWKLPGSLNGLPKSGLVGEKETNLYLIAEPNPY